MLFFVIYIILLQESDTIKYLRKAMQVAIKSRVSGCFLTSSTLILQRDKIESRDTIYSAIYRSWKFRSPGDLNIEFIEIHTPIYYRVYRFLRTRARKRNEPTSIRSRSERSVTEREIQLAPAGRLEVAFH